MQQPKLLDSLYLFCFIWLFVAQWEFIAQKPGSCLWSSPTVPYKRTSTTNFSAPGWVCVCRKWFSMPQIMLWNWEERGSAESIAYGTQHLQMASSSSTNVLAKGWSEGRAVNPAPEFEVILPAMAPFISGWEVKNEEKALSLCCFPTSPKGALHLHDIQESCQGEDQWLEEQLSWHTGERERMFAAWHYINFKIMKCEIFALFVCFHGAVIAPHGQE